MTRNDPSTPKDEWLADFADSILDGETDSPPADGPDPETLALAESLLRLKHAFPKQELDSASVKRMRARVLERWREEQEKKPRWLEAFRLEWLNPSRRQQHRMAFAMLALAGILIVSAPILFKSGGPLSATAGSSMPGAFIWIALGALALSLFWLLRRKS